MSNNTNTVNNILACKIAIPLLLSKPPGMVKAAAKVTVAISVATTRLVSFFFDSSSKVAIGVVVGVAFGSSGDSNFLKSRRTYCWKIGTPIDLPKMRNFLLHLPMASYN